MHGWLPRMASARDVDAASDPEGSARPRVGPPFMNRRTRQLMSESVLMRASAGLWARSIGLDRHLRAGRRDRLDLSSPDLPPFPPPAAGRRGTPEGRSGRCAVQIRHVAPVRPALQVEAVVGLHKGARDLLAWRLANALDLNPG